MNILRRLPLSRLLLLCALVVVLGASATALALAVDTGPVPPAEPLAVAVHDALGGASVEGVSATITLTDHLLEGASLSGGEAAQLASSPLLAGASGRLWIAKDGRVRLELQAEGGDTEVLYDGGRTVTIYDAATNTLYRYALPPAKEARAASQSAGQGTSTQITQDFKPADGAQVPSLARVEEAIAKLERHADVSGATPTDIAGQPAYTVRVSPDEDGSLIGGAELSFDAVHGVPLRAALYSSTSASPVIELTADEVAYGPVESSIFSFSPPAGAKVVEVAAPKPAAPGHGRAGHAAVKTYGHGPSTIAVLEAKAAAKGVALPEGLPKVELDGISAAELPTALGTLLGFERAGVRYLLLGAVTPASIETVARGL